MLPNETTTFSSLLPCLLTGRLGLYRAPDFISLPRGRLKPENTISTLALQSVVRRRSPIRTIGIQLCHVPRRNWYHVFLLMFRSSRTYQRWPDNAMQRTASHSALRLMAVCRPCFHCVESCVGLAVADLVSR